MSTLIQSEDGKPAYTSLDWGRSLCFIAWCDGCGRGHVKAAILTMGRRPNEYGGFHDVPIEAVCSACGTASPVVCCESLFGDRRCAHCAPGPIVHDVCHILHTERWPGGECCICGAHAATIDDPRLIDADHMHDSVRSGDFD